MLASPPCLPRLALFVAASDVKAGRPGRFWYVRLRQADTNVTSTNEKASERRYIDASYSSTAGYETRLTRTRTRTYVSALTPDPAPKSLTRLVGVGQFFGAHL